MTATSARPHDAAGSNDARAALVHARLDTPGGADELAGLLRDRAERYAYDILRLPREGADEVAAAAVARSLRTLPRHLGPDELMDHLHLAVRHEAWRRQTGRGAHPVAVRALAAAALVLVLTAVGALAVAVSGSLGGPGAAPDTVVAVQSDDASVEGRVVDTTASGTVLAGRSGVTVSAVVDGATVRTTESDETGRFLLSGLEATTYAIRVDVPDGLHLRGATDGRSTEVDLSGAPAASLILELQRS